MNDSDDLLMYRCLQLASLGGVDVAPNPMVGAVLVYNGVIIGEGWHKQHGQAHAEVNCIADALKHNLDKIDKATLYVSLEPCAHHGKTPPCADLIVKHKIPKVVIACRDSFEKVKGKGIERLKNAGIEITESVLQKEAIELNKRFFTFHESKRPYVILKWAKTADGFVASESNERLMISNEVTNRLVHKWRSEEAAIMVGKNTVMKDDPLLDNRFWYGKSPEKVIIDLNNEVPLSLRLFSGNTVKIIINAEKEGMEGSVQYVSIEHNSIKNVLDKLYQLNIQSVFVEGGQKLLQSFIDAGLWDEARIITNIKLYIGTGLASPKLKDAVQFNKEFFENDSVEYFKNVVNQFC